MEAVFQVVRQFRPYECWPARISAKKIPRSYVVCTFQSGKKEYRQREHQRHCRGTSIPIQLEGTGIIV